MTDDLSTPGAWRREFIDLVADLRSSLKPSHIRQILTVEGAGEWTLALEFLMDYIIDEQIVISSATYARIEALARVLRPREGLVYVRELVLDLDE